MINVVIGIKTDKSGNQDHNAALFEHINVVNMNSTEYSPVDANANLTKYQFAQFYKYMKEFTYDYNGMRFILEV